MNEERNEGDCVGELRLRRIGRVCISVLDRSDAIRQVLRDVESRRPTFVTFCNAHTVNLATKSSEFEVVLSGAKVFNDGVGVDLASRLLYGRPFPANLVGTDLVPAILDSSPSKLRLFLLGSAPGVAEKAGAAMEKRGLGHEIVGTHHGFFAADKEDEVRAIIKRANPNLVLVGMGQPRQELWASRNFRSFEAVAICVGALFEFEAGTVPRAPPWMRRARVEWIHRLIQEPHRLWRRYLVGNVEFLGRVLQEFGRFRSNEKYRY